ncbi:MAG: hypothetical protein QOI38_1109 [Sphingomonadales bacterium]|nr:hypothetical protein [Sphingomonadales bacterium]
MRARLLPVLAFMFIVQQMSFFASHIEDPARLVDSVKIGAWLVMSIMLLLILTVDGAWLQRPSVRALLYDEVTRAHRAAAARVGFIASMFGGVFLYFLTFVEPVSGRDAIHLLVTVGIATALIRFGVLERRAHKGG